jgi:hypothetical protein
MSPIRYRPDRTLKARVELAPKINSKAQEGGVGIAYPFAVVS